MWFGYTEELLDVQYRQADVTEDAMNQTNTSSAASAQMAPSGSSGMQREIQDGMETTENQEANAYRKISEIADETKDKEATTLAYLKLPIFTANYDAPFKFKTAALIYLRAVNLARETGFSDIAFQLAANVRGAGQFGDLVLRLSSTNNFSAFFLQLKPTANLVVSRKVLADPDSCFPLKTYFKSYLEIKESLAAAEEGSLFDLAVDDCVFAAYTNARGGRKLGSTHGKTFTVLSLESVVHSYVKDARYHRFPKSGGSLRNCLREDGDDGEKFLSQFRIFTGQPELHDLDELIREELRKFDYAKYSYLDVGRLGACFLENVKEWWEKDNVVLDKNSDILERARSVMYKV